MPTKTSRGRKGITASCSRVPAWRSRTTPRAVATVPTNTRMIPQRPGIMMTAVRRSGLKRTSTLRRLQGPGPSRRVAGVAPLGLGPAGAGPQLREAAQRGLRGEQLGAVDQQRGALSGRGGRDDGHNRLSATQGVAGVAAAVAGRIGDARRAARGGRRRPARPGPDDDGGHLLDVEARRVAEDDEEQEREQEQHRDRASVAAQLPELLESDGPHCDDPPSSRAPVSRIHTTRIQRMLNSKARNRRGSRSRARLRSPSDVDAGAFLLEYEEMLW